MVKSGIVLFTHFFFYPEKLKPSECLNIISLPHPFEVDYPSVRTPLTALQVLKVMLSTRQCDIGKLFTDTTYQQIIALVLNV